MHPFEGVIVAFEGFCWLCPVVLVYINSLNCYISSTSLSFQILKYLSFPFLVVWHSVTRSGDTSIITVIWILFSAGCFDAATATSSSSPLCFFLVQTFIIHPSRIIPRQSCVSGTVISQMLRSRILCSLHIWHSCQNSFCPSWRHSISLCICCSWQYGALCRVASALVYVWVVEQDISPIAVYWSECVRADLYKAAHLVSLALKL